MVYRAIPVGRQKKKGIFKSLTKFREDTSKQKVHEYDNDTQQHMVHPGLGMY